MPYVVPTSRFLTLSLSDDEDSVAGCDGDVLRNSSRSHTYSGRKSSAAHGKQRGSDAHAHTHAASLT